MTHTAGIDIGSTYTKAVVTDEHDTIVSRALAPTGFRLAEVARSLLSPAGDRDLDVVHVHGHAGAGRAPRLSIHW